VTPQSIGRFQELDTESQQEILSRICLTQSNLTLRHKSISEIAKTFNYQISQPDKLSTSLIDQLTFERKADIWKRHLSIAHFRKSNYPIEFHDGLA